MLSVLRIHNSICFGRKTPNNASLAKLMRSFSESRDVKSRAQKTILKALQKPSPLAAGTGAAVTGAALLGMGAICVYGRVIGSNANDTNRSTVWPQFVIDRVRTTFGFFGSSLVIITAISVYLYRNINSLGVLGSTSGVAFLAPLIILNLIKLVETRLPYSERIGAKHAVWLGHHVFVAALLSSLCFVGGAMVLKSALHAAVITSSFTVVAACAPSDRFLNIGGSLSMGLGAVIASTLIQVFFVPNTTTARLYGVSTYSLCLYGGLLLFSGFLLYNTKRLVKNANSETYDPLGTSMSLSVSTTNLIVTPLLAATALKLVKY